MSRHEVEPSGALIVQDVIPGDDGVYSCRVENLLGQVNKSAKLSVKCKLKYFLYLMRFKVHTFVYILLERKKERRNDKRQFMEGNSVHFTYYQVIFL